MTIENSGVGALVSKLKQILGSKAKNVWVGISSGKITSVSAVPPSNSTGLTSLYVIKNTKMFFQDFKKILDRENARNTVLSFIQK